jgi:hypothetical protein
METTTLGFFARFALAFVAFFRILVNGRFAARVRALHRGTLEVEAPSAVLNAALAEPSLVPQPAVAPKPPPVVDHRAEAQADALHLLAILQRDGRFIDFLQEDLASYGDAQVGAAARAVHAGCRQAVTAYFTLEPVYREPEGASVLVDRNFDPGAIRLTGNVIGSPPFRGSLKHHGWKAMDVHLPDRPEGQDPNIVAPAEVELS